jgi:UDP-N-acetylmuramate--alanine ligase
MNALAQALKGGGWTVSGSDRYEDQGQDLEVIRKLKEAGIHFYPQDGQGVKPGTGAVVISTAIEQDNPDIAAAKRFQVPVRHRAEMLAELVSGREVVAIAGTSGKTTVTGMVGWLLEQLGGDPTVVNGGVLVNWANDRCIGNARTGKSRICVIEVDESDRSLLRFSPDWALITNMSADHFNLEETDRLFAQFRSQVRKDCLVGWAPEMPWHGVPLKLDKQGVRFNYEGLAFEIPVLGAHNAENAMQAAALCQRMGFALGPIRDALSRFQGIQRRLEKIGDAAGVTVLDEYAHNPAKIAAAWRAVAPHYQRVLAFWRPHGFKPLALMFDDLVETFATLCRPDDRLYLMPVYYAGGTVSKQRDSDELVAKLRERGIPAAWMTDYEVLMAEMMGQVRAEDVVLCMGARDPGIPQFARKLVAALKK